MNSLRFGRRVRITRHAQARMDERNIDADRLLDLIDTGELRHKDEHRLWIAKFYPDRDDNLLCVAAVIEEALVIKTVMHRFSWSQE
jgi:hypothetical protein